MPAYIIETGRSYPNVVSEAVFGQTFQRPAFGGYQSHDNHSGPGTNYQITFNNFGPGSMIGGKDVVLYLGDDDETCVGNCDGFRRPVYRWYRSKYQDHTYTNKKVLDHTTDFPNDPNAKQVMEGYNREPRDGRAVFHIAREQAAGSTALYRHYNATLNDTMLSTTQSPPSGYANVETIGYIWTSQANADVYKAAGESVRPLYEYYYNTNTSKRDHFYTINPAQEVGLQNPGGGVPDCKDTRDGLWGYVGIVGYCFELDKSSSAVTTYADIGSIGPTGECNVNRSNWYQWNNEWTLLKYLREQNGVPAIQGWGNPDNVAGVNTTDALFEWFYGRNGAVKAALPRYLSFEQSYDSQFIYYLYDTTYPWNGPVYGINFSLSDAACCPNSTDAEGCPACVPVPIEYSRFYEVRSDCWETLKTKMTLSDMKSKNVNESFLVADTTSTRILFRYTTATGSFFIGEKINGWNITQVRYFGDELKVGYMELSWDASDDNKWYVNPACVAWRITNSSGGEITNSVTEKGSWIAIGAPTNAAVPWTAHMDAYGIYPVKPADDAVDPNIGVWQVHTATFTIPSAGTYSLRIESDNYGYMKITDSGSTVLVDREINYSNGMGNETFPMTLGAGTYTLETRVKNISRDIAGAPFTYNGSYTSTDGGVAQVLAGYGIRDKGAFFGVYEFPKKITYYRVEIDPQQLIANRTLDSAELRANINSEGQVQSVDIINGGFGYAQPKIEIEQPAVLTERSANDNARKVFHNMGGWDQQFVNSPNDPVNNPDGTKNNFGMKDIKKKQSAVLEEDMSESYQERENLMPYGKGAAPGDVQIKGTNTVVNTGSKQLRRASGEGKGKTPLKKAVLEIANINEDGSIVEILIKDRGSGYDPDPNNKPNIYIVDTEKEEYKMRGPNVNLSTKTFKDNIRAENGLKDAIKSGSDAEEEEINQMDDGIIGGFNTMMNGFTTKYPTGYLRIKDYDDESTDLCSNFPATCIGIDFPNIFEDALFTAEDLTGPIKASPRFREMMNNQYPDMLSAVRLTDDRSDGFSDLWGWNNRKNCIKLPQPKLYTATRFFDIPCPYIELNEEKKQRAYGYMVYKYCASKAEKASFRVSMALEGHTTGPQGQDFMNFLRNMPEPSLTFTRDSGPGGNSKCWPCKRGDIEGRCYRDPSNASDIVFVPVGSDENTYDYNRSGFSEYEQFKTWLGDNLTNHSPGTSYTWIAHEEDPETGQELDVRQWSYTDITVAMPVNGVPPNECWDTYLRHASNPNGCLDVYCGYNPANPGTNKTASTGYWGVGYIANPPCAGHLALDFVSDAAIAINPRLVSEFEILLGPFNGTMTVLNYNTGSTITYGESIKNFGNPYFSECDLVFGNMTNLTNPGTLIDNTKRISPASYDPSDSDRDEFDKEFIIPENHFSET